MVFYTALVLIFICIAMSLRMLFIPHKIKGKMVSLENFFILAIIYMTVMLGFGMVYVMLEMHGHPILLEGNQHMVEDFFNRLEKGIYFSAVTLFSVGYGDIAPIGIGRFISVLEALIGYTIPAAFVARAVLDMDHKGPEL